MCPVEYIRLPFFFLAHSSLALAHFRAVHFGRYWNTMFICTHLTLDRFAFARTLSVCFCPNKILRIIQMVFSSAGIIVGIAAAAAFFTLERWTVVSIFAVCICSTFSVASSISTACHFLIPCELIVCHSMSHPVASTLAIPSHFLLFLPRQPTLVTI